MVSLFELATYALLSIGNLVFVRVIAVKNPIPKP